MERHRNSQKRFYNKGAVYFVTTNTRYRYSFFEEDILSRLFVLTLELCQVYKDFVVLAYKVNPDHVHMLIKPGDRFNISEVMFSVKKQFSHEANRVMLYNDMRMDARDATPKAPTRLGAFGVVSRAVPITMDTLMNAIVRTCRMEYMQKHAGKPHHPKFKWQKSYHDHVIRKGDDFINHVRYIERQWIKHGLGENKWCYVCDMDDD